MSGVENPVCQAAAIIFVSRHVSVARYAGARHGCVWMTKTSDDRGTSKQKSVQRSRGAGGARESRDVEQAKLNSRS